MDWRGVAGWELQGDRSWSAFQNVLTPPLRSAGTKAECAPPADANSVRSCRKNSRHVLAIWKRSLPSEALERQTAVGRQREWPVLPDTIVLGRRQARADIPRCDVASALLDRDDRGVSYAHPRVVLCLLGGEWRPFCLLDAGDL